MSMKLNCLVCGTPLRVFGNVTMHYEPDVSKIERLAVIKELKLVKEHYNKTLDERIKDLELLDGKSIWKLKIYLYKNNQKHPWHVINCVTYLNQIVNLTNLKQGR